ncbi:MAG: hypothetical protein AAFO91_07690 [Bacteroidota bacterium]
MIPQSFEEWRNCIVHDCKIKLTQDFALGRLKVYEDRSKAETKLFVKLYGEDHLNNIIHWLKRVAATASVS